jgi:hypothetical protein
MVFVEAVFTDHKEHPVCTSRDKSNNHACAKRPPRILQWHSFYYASSCFHVFDNLSFSSSLDNRDLSTKTMAGSSIR